MKLFKKAIALVAVVVLSTTAFVGCRGQKDIDNKEIVMKVGDTEIDLGMANFYIRYRQPAEEATMEQYAMYGYELNWDDEIEDGVTSEESMKQGTLESLQQLYVLKAHAEEFKVTITEAEQKKIDEVAKAFKKANSKEVYEKISGEYVGEYLQLVTIAQKMYDAVKASHTPEVKDEEANQKIMYYVEYATTSTDSSGNTTKLTDKEVENLKKDAKAFLDGSKEKGNLESYAKEKSLTAKKQAFNAKNETLDKALVKAADALKLNEFTDVIVGESAIYVAQVTSLFDKDATETQRKSLIEERKNEYYTETLDKWVKDTEIKVFDKVWDQISLDGLKVTAKPQEEKEDTTENKTENKTEDKAEDKAEDKTDDKTENKTEEKAE